MRLGFAGHTAIVGSKGRRYALIAFGVSAMVTASIGASVAEAAPVTVGSPLQGSFVSENYAAALTVFNVALPESGVHVNSPVSGTVVKWHITQAVGGPFALVVATQNTGGSYTATAVSTGGSPVNTGIQTFATDLPIKAGQTVGLNNSSSADRLGVLLGTSAEYSFLEPPLSAGTTGSPTGSGPYELGFNAVVQPLPKITHLSSHSGSRKGGKKITVKGKNFDGTKAVKFGSTKAKSFKVLSDTKIKAVTPRHHAGTVHVTVFNPGKSHASAASKFKFKP